MGLAVAGCLVVGSGVSAHAGTQAPGSTATDTTGLGAGHVVGSGAWTGGACGGAGCKVPFHCSATGQGDTGAAAIQSCTLLNMGGGTDMNAHPITTTVPFATTAGLATANLPFGSVTVCWTVWAGFILEGTVDFDSHCTPQVDLPI